MICSCMKLWDSDKQGCIKEHRLSPQITWLERTKVVGNSTHMLNVPQLLTKIWIHWMAWQANSILTSRQSPDNSRLAYLQPLNPVHYSTDLQHKEALCSNHIILWRRRNTSWKPSPTTWPWWTILFTHCRVRKMKYGRTHSPKTILWKIAWKVKWATKYTGLSLLTVSHRWKGHVLSQRKEHLDISREIKQHKPNN